VIKYHQLHITCDETSSMDKLSLLKLFVNAVDHGGFKAAANHLGLSASTVSKGMARLEDNLSLKLFNRSTRQVHLTDSGSRYLVTARRIVLELEQCEQELKQTNDLPSGEIKINLPVSYGRLYIMPLLKEFTQLYPDITLEVSFNDSYVDILEQGIDLTIRTGKIDDQRLVARMLSPIDFILCASPTYIASNSFPTCAAEYSQYSWVRFRYSQSGRLMPITVDEGEGVKSYDPGSQFVVNDGEALAELCAQGFGLTQLPHFIARDWLKTKRIVPISSFFRSSEGVYCVYPKREFLPKKVKVLIDYLIMKIEKNGENTYHTWAETLQPVMHEIKR
jgi:DNA-binding transcriptional LysR family regulator